jgi:creatinine amidohydrolase
MAEKIRAGSDTLYLRRITCRAGRRMSWFWARAGQVNGGRWIASYTLNVLRDRVNHEPVILPICSLDTPATAVEAVGGLLLPPLYHEALRDEPGLKDALVEAIGRCFPFFEGTRARKASQARVRVVELPSTQGVDRPPPPGRVGVLAVGADTTIEQHGPHLPLGTDTLQTYAVFAQLAAEDADVTVAPPLDYGHLTWGLPFGLSIDLTPALLGRYARAYLRALIARYAPAALYVAGTHGSVGHRATLEGAVRDCGCARAAFRWLPEAIGEFSSARGDLHAGAVETALMRCIAPEAVDAAWWPAQEARLAAGQMLLEEVLRLSADMPAFSHAVEARGLNGIVGDVRNTRSLDGRDLLQRMVALARRDVASLRR